MRDTPVACRTSLLISFSAFPLAAPTATNLFPSVVDFPGADTVFVVGVPVGEGLEGIGIGEYRGKIRGSTLARQVIDRAGLDRSALPVCLQHTVSGVGEFSCFLPERACPSGTDPILLYNGDYVIVLVHLPVDRELEPGDEYWIEVVQPLGLSMFISKTAPALP